MRPGFSHGFMLALGSRRSSPRPALPDGWPRWRGPNDDGMARGDAPLQWSDKERMAWKVPVPGRGNSSPVVWGDRIFLTTAVPTGNAPRPARRRPPPAGRRGGRAVRSPNTDLSCSPTTARPASCFGRRRRAWPRRTRAITPSTAASPRTRRWPTAGTSSPSSARAASTATRTTASSSGRRILASR